MLIPKFSFTKSGLELARCTQYGTFFDCIGRRSAVYGYEHGGLEAWVHPLKVVDDFRLSFHLAGYPLEFPGAEIMTGICVRPEATTFTYTHAAFTVQQIIYVPIYEPGVIMLLDIDTALPLVVCASFRPRLRLAWPAASVTSNPAWDAQAQVYYLTEETGRFAGIVGSPVAHEKSAQSYQEEPREQAAEFQIEALPEQMRSHFVPIIIAASADGSENRSPVAHEEAKRTYDRLLASAQELYEQNVTYYGQLQQETTSIETPDERFNSAFAWAKVGIDKGFATNAHLGTGLVAGFRTSGDSERAGFAWFFGRDALWTALALTASGDCAATRTALAFLQQYQRADGKIPHEIAQSASLLPWFTGYPYAWASADATPLYCIVHADLWRTSGDLGFLQANWESIKRAYEFTLATDTDGNGLIENTAFGHGWVEGGALYPPHEEIYLQGLWIVACQSIAELAEVMNEKELAAQARERAEQTRTAVEETYWLADKEYYAFATERSLTDKFLIDEDTVLPAVPLWWHTLDTQRAQKQLDHLGSARIATDWGARIISAESRLYDPLSYHYGSVWPLFTGWVSVAAYVYGRPHIGYQALMANASLTYTEALGYVTELLSGDFSKSFSHSSHHQVWSEAMIVLPTLRGMMGLAVSDAGRTLRFAPQLPANWEGIKVRGVAAGSARYDLTMEREEGRRTITVVRRASNEQGVRSSLTDVTPATRTATELANALTASEPHQFSGSQPATAVPSIKLILAPAFPLDAQVLGATVNNQTAKFDVTRQGDVQHVTIIIEDAPSTVQIVFALTEGTEVYTEPEPLLVGARSRGLRVIRARVEKETLRLVLEGLSGCSYKLSVRTPYLLNEVSGVQVKHESPHHQQLLVNFDSASNMISRYVRRELVVPLCRVQDGRV